MQCEKQKRDGGRCGAHALAGKKYSDEQCNLTSMVCTVIGGVMHQWSQAHRLLWPAPKRKLNATI